MKLKLSTIFMRNFVAKMISDTIYKKYGYLVEVHINQLNIETVDGKLNLHADVEASTETTEITNIIKSKFKFF